MGIIILPLFLFWLVCFLFSFRMGYVLLKEEKLFAYKILPTIAAILLAFLYMKHSINQFESSESLWAFEIIFYFLFNLDAAALYLAALLSYFILRKRIKNPSIKSLIFIIALSISLGTLLGAFGSEAFMEKNNIEQTY
ncbi:hypothetical protein KDW99_16690 [Marinomonas rhizomae]|uniref:hypothetical protein n=1 Tax=Marinomonas rhizomae TaxID=491948 RepID=UPI002102985B|nr:hypothetical protein [Marinomonas rhizomae]UTV98873.1 hypothetical protein KDW99_16690 [Marinomonas rhizomae]